MRGHEQLWHWNLLLSRFTTWLQPISDMYRSTQAFFSGAHSGAVEVSVKTQDSHLASPRGTEYTHSKLRALGLSWTLYFGRFLNLHTLA